MAWIILIIAGLLEMVWSFALKQSAGFTRLGWSVGFVVAAGASMYLLAVAMRSLPLGTAYAIWTGIGAVGAFVVGIAVLGEQATALRILAVGLIVAGLALLKYVTPDAPAPN